MTNTDNNKIPSTNSNNLSQLLLTISLMSAISLLSLLGYDTYRYQPIMTVDVETIMQKKMNQIQAQPEKMGNKELINLSKQWAQQLASEVAGLSTQYNAVVLVRPAVVEGSIDMTQHIMDSLDGLVK